MAPRNHRLEGSIAAGLDDELGYDTNHGRRQIVLHRICNRCEYDNS